MEWRGVREAVSGMGARETAMSEMDGVAAVFAAIIKGMRTECHRL